MDYSRKRVFEDYIEEMIVNWVLMISNSFLRGEEKAWESTCK